MARVAAGATLASASFAFALALLSPFTGRVARGGTIAGLGVSGWNAGTTSVSLAGGSGYAGTLSFIAGIVVSGPPFTDLAIFVGGHAPGAFGGETLDAVGGVLPFQGRVGSQAFGGLCLLDVPVVVGKPISDVRVVSGVGQTTRGARWTVGVAQVRRTQPTPSGATVPSRMGHDGLDGSGVGTLVLVSAPDPAGRLASWAAPPAAALLLAARRRRDQRARKTS